MKGEEGEDQNFSKNVRSDFYIVFHIFSYSKMKRYRHVKRLKIKKLKYYIKKNSKSAIEHELTESYTFMANDKRDVPNGRGGARGEGGGGGFFRKQPRKTRENR